MLARSASATTTRLPRGGRGAYGSYSPPGVLTEVGYARTRPADAVHFASADLSDAWPGYMEGAIHSGERAADAVLRSL